MKPSDVLAVENGQQKRDRHTRLLISRGKTGRLEWANVDTPAMRSRENNTVTLPSGTPLRESTTQGAKICVSTGMATVCFRGVNRDQRSMAARTTPENTNARKNTKILIENKKNDTARHEGTYIDPVLFRHGRRYVLELQEIVSLPVT